MILRAHRGSASWERIMGAQASLPAWLPDVPRESEVAVRGKRQARMPALPGRVLASPGDRLIELRIELESQTAFSLETNGLEFIVQIPRPRL